MNIKGDRYVRLVCLIYHHLSILVNSRFRLGYIYDDHHISICFVQTLLVSALVILNAYVESLVSSYLIRHFVLFCHRASRHVGRWIFNSDCRKNLIAATFVLEI